MERASQTRAQQMREMRRDHYRCRHLLPPVQPGESREKETMDTKDLLIWLALGFAVASFFKPQWPFVSCAIVFMCVRLLL